MTDFNGLDYYEANFNADGSLNQSAGGDGGVVAAVAAGTVKNLFVFSHGWNNGANEARGLYQSLFSFLGDQLGDHRAESAALGIIWPSLLFPDDAAATPAAGAAAPASGAQVAAALAPAFTGREADLSTMGQLLDTQPENPQALAQFKTLADGLVTTPPNDAGEDSGEAGYQQADAVQAFSHAQSMAPTPGGGAAGSGSIFSHLWSGAREVLRTLSYYEMKNRAGVVGTNGLGPLLAGIVDAAGGRPIRIHLAGHSFGARLVSYSLSGVPAAWTGPASPIGSLYLVQGAFSHFAFTPKLNYAEATTGALSGFSDRVNGPLMCTFSNFDRATGWWYPAASLLSRTAAASASDLTYEWGAVGHDGYQLTPPAPSIALGPVGTSYQFQPGQFYPLDANATICHGSSLFSGAHSDIRYPDVTWPMISAAGLA